MDFLISLFWPEIWALWSQVALATKESDEGDKLLYKVHAYKRVALVVASFARTLTHNSTDQALEALRKLRFLDRFRTLASKKTLTFDEKVRAVHSVTQCKALSKRSFCAGSTCLFEHAGMLRECQCVD